MPRKTWKDLSVARKRMIILGGMLQLSLLIAAQIDIQRRPSAAIRGSKAVWRAAVFVNGVGPLLYFLVGRKRSEPMVVAV